MVGALSWRMGRFSQFCLTLFAPWLAPLLRQVVLCRVVVATVMVLGTGHLLGYTLWPCLFANVTGLPCPGCGMTRAMGALVRGEGSTAMQFHPFAPGFLALGLLVALVALTPRNLHGGLVRIIERLEVKTRAPTFFLLAAVIYGLLRMGGLCSNPSMVNPAPTRPWFQERRSAGR